jgi:hypothetical protein
MASTPTSGPLDYPLEFSGCRPPGIAGNDEDGHAIFHETPRQMLAMQRREAWDQQAVYSVPCIILVELLSKFAEKRKVTATKLAIAWLLAKKP